MHFHCYLFFLHPLTERTRASLLALRRVAAKGRDGGKEENENEKEKEKGFEWLIFP